MQNVTHSKFLNRLHTIKLHKYLAISGKDFLSILTNPGNGATPQVANLLNDVKFFTALMKYFLGLDLSADLMPGYRELTDVLAMVSLCA